MKKIENSSPKGPRTLWYLVGTGAYCLVVGLSSLFLGFFDFTDPSRRALNPHEWGDVLAGVFSPLAFLWLVYASLSQKAELELQRGELSLNNVAQRDQFSAMSEQAEAMKKQAELLREQVDRESARLEKEARELRVWCELYLQGVARYHDALINHTGHLARDIKPLLPLHASRAHEFFSLDNFRGTAFVESGIPRFHYFDAETEIGLIALIGRLEKARLAEKNYIVRAQSTEQISATDVDRMNTVLNQLAVEAHNLASAGLRRLKEAAPERGRE